MLTSFLIALFTFPSEPSQTTGNAWFGPSTVVFDLPSRGNPFDPAQNDVVVVFRGPKSEEKRLAFYSQGKWHVTLAAKQKGIYVGRVLRNGQATGVELKAVLRQPLKQGFVRVGGPRGFRLDDGTPYWPVGFNMAWQSENCPDLATALRDMPKIGVNWTRIWANHWDGKNPFWVKSDPLQFDEKALNRWQGLVEAAESGGVKFQMVMFHHGPWSTRVNSNWAENPLNKANGGFLEKPTDFFTDPRARQVQKAWLRYAVARYGASPAVMSWELFNEVEWVDPNYEEKQALVGEWHAEMAAYVRSIDPYKHLVTTSSDMKLPIYAKMDYYQPHGYPNRVQPMLLAAKLPKDKPLFYGEVGPSNFQGGVPLMRLAIRDGVFSALFKGHAGAGQYWFWDNVYPNKLGDEFAFASSLLKDSGLLGIQSTEQNLTIDAPAADLKIQPAGGWEPFHQYEFKLPSQEAQLGGLSAYFQGTSKPEMRAKPVRLTFASKSPVTAKISFAGVSSGGGNLLARIDGKEVARITFASNEKPDGKTLDIPLPAGSVVLELDNDGPDWVQIKEIVLPGLGQAASLIGTGSQDRALLRFQRDPSAAAFETSIRGLTLRDGTYTLTLADLDKKTKITRNVQVRKGTLTGTLKVEALDAILLLKKR